MPLRQPEEPDWSYLTNPGPQTEGESMGEPIPEIPSRLEAAYACLYNMPAHGTAWPSEVAQRRLTSLEYLGAAREDLQRLLAQIEGRRWVTPWTVRRWAMQLRKALR